jgi:3',5'-cyclic AMP phosphodiesterase CpdA
MNTKPVRYHAVVSDLHFGDGGKLDDFVHEQELKTFLSYVSEQGRVRSGSAELVINGDFIDFLQVQPLRHGPWREAIDKVSRVAGAHPDTFEALGRFVKEGNRVVILPGNHDIELSFREVQEAFTALIAAGDPDVTSRIVFPNSEPLGSHFRGWEHGPFAYRLKAPSAPGLSVYIEHGNQFDVVNSFNHRKFFHESLADHIRMPWGSRFVLDILNDVEARFPYIDKIRPRHAALMPLRAQAPGRLRWAWGAALPRAPPLPS